MVVVLWAVLYAQLAPLAAGRPFWVAATLTTVTALGFGASVVAHELAHAIVARALGLPVVEVTVFHLGGVTKLGREPDDWRDETLIAVAGPLLNLLLGGGLLAAGVLLGPGSLVGGVLLLLGYLNGSVGVFNLLPGHPLDGGALVRAGTWAITGDANGAMRISSRLGQGLGVALLVGGVVGALGGVGADLGDGDASWLWLALIGAFILSSARVGVVRATVRAALSDLRVADLARDAAFVVPGSTPVGAVVAPLARGEGLGVVAGDDGVAIGTFGDEQLAEVPPADWAHATVEAAMRPVAGAVAHDDAVLEVLSAFQGAPAAVLAVTRAGRTVATLAAEDVLAHVDRAGA